VIHRDIKLENILINNKSEGEYDVKIADFGMATFCKESEGNLIN
jgi:serine/threonine protein kinase